ncbi:MAG: pyruvate kinase [Nitrospirae bacterium]|nr:pyruvate kinase [Nitrospirota bacterium]
MRRAKIVCTIGSATRSAGKIADLIRAGADMFRLNFSHGAHGEHAETIGFIREASKQLGKPVAILQDLQGPRIRLGTFKEGAVSIRRGDRFTLTSRPVSGDQTQVSVNDPALIMEAGRSARIFVADGLIQLRVRQATDTDLVCEVVDGGTLSDHKGVNLPGVDFHREALTEKDREDIRFGLEQCVDYIAVSFVQGPEDVMAAKQLMKGGKQPVPIIAKLETPKAVRRLDSILDVADGVMIARGDLGVEMEPEEVPLVQKEIIEKANGGNVTVITATQMLESMTHNPRPTRAEASDVANAVFDGTDAVMLSAETTIGLFPVEAVSMMHRIVESAESRSVRWHRTRKEERHGAGSLPEASCEAAAHAAMEIGAKAIVAFTQSGSTARLISKFRPAVPILAFASSETVRQRMALYWGVEPRFMPPIDEADRLIAQVERILMDEGLARSKDRFVIVFGFPIRQKGPTNMIKLHQIE